MAKSSKYWNHRALRRLMDAEKQSEKTIAAIQKMYDRAERNIRREMEELYRNYAKAAGPDVQSLKTLLTKTETDKLREKWKRQGLDKYLKENVKARLTRLECIQAQIYAKAKELYPQEQKAHTEHYSSVLRDSYYKTIYETQIGMGMEISFSKIDDNMVQALLEERWSGKNYSERIWGNTDLLAESVSEIIGGAMMSGQSLAKTSRQVRERFDTAKYYAQRLVRTETNHFHNEADAMAYEQMGLERYVFLATLDTRTSTICQKLDQKVFPLKDRRTGVNFPPMHPNCRSKTGAYPGEEMEAALKRRARDPITGKNQGIGNLSYEEWYDSKVKEHGKAEVDKAYKMADNLSADKKQYERYAARLGEKNVGTLDKFRQIKYNNTAAYKEVAEYYRYKGRYGGIPMKTVYCPVKEGRINGIDCLVMCDVADGLINQTMIPEGIQWDEQQRRKCLACKYHADIE